MKVSTRRTQDYYTEILLKEKKLDNSENYNNYKILTLSDDNNFYVVIFEGKKAKPIVYIRVVHSRLDSYIKEQKELILEKTNKKKSVIEAYKNKGNLIVENSILYSSWGFEQTNINFYKVLSRKGQTLELQELSQKRNYERDDSGTCTPGDVLIGEPFKRRLTKYATININSVEYASLYDGKKMYFSKYY